MVEIEIRPRFSRGLTEIHPRSTSKFSLNLPKLPVGLRKLRSLHHHSASPRPFRDGRVLEVSSEAPFLLPLCRVRRQTIRTRLYGLRKAPPVRNGAKGPFGPEGRSEQSVHSREMGWCVRCRSPSPFDRTKRAAAAKTGQKSMLKVKMRYLRLQQKPPNPYISSE